MKTKVIEGDFKGNAIFAVWELDEEGNKKGDRPIVSMGKKKLKAILDHQEEAKQFIGQE